MEPGCSKAVHMPVLSTGRKCWVKTLAPMPLHPGFLGQMASNCGEMESGLEGHLVWSSRLLLTFACEKTEIIFLKIQQQKPKPKLNQEKLRTLWFKGKATEKQNWHFILYLSGCGGSLLFFHLCWGVKSWLVSPPPPSLGFGASAPAVYWLRQPLVENAFAYMG